MQAAVIVFPGSNCDRDLAVAFEKFTGKTARMIWHKESSLPDGIDVIGIPGGFSFGDYLRCGAIAARAPIMREVLSFAEKGGPVIGICNGFQVLIEAGLLPGALMRNAGLKFVCKTTALRVETSASPFTSHYQKGQTAYIPVAHHDGNYVADEVLRARLKGDDRIAFTYHDNPNGSADEIAGILSENRRILGMMPHPERAIDPAHGGTDGAPLFEGLVHGLIPA